MPICIASRENEGTAIDVLARLGVTGDAIRSALNDLVGQSAVYAGTNFDPTVNTSDSMLKEFGTDLTKKAADGKLDPVIGRAGEIERVMQILSRRQKNNPLLIGEPGVGKTAVVEGLAQLIVADQVPAGISPESILKEASGVISRLTGCTAVTTTPSGEESRIHRIRFVQTGSHTAMAVVIASNGIIKTKLFRCDFLLNPELLP